MKLLADFASRTVGGLAKYDDRFSRHGDVAVALEHFSYCLRHLARTAHQFSELLPCHPSLHPIGAGYRLWQFGEIKKRPVNTLLDVDKP